MSRTVTFWRLEFGGLRSEARGGWTPPPAFWKKRLQTIENKGGECRKERQEPREVQEAAIPCKEKSWRFGRQKRVSLGNARRVHLRAMRMVVKRRELRDKQFVSL
jgi:hypothetical protein